MNQRFLLFLGLISDILNHKIMEELKIRKFNDPILREKAQPVERVDEEIKELASQMAKIMLENEGMGLAAPQVGISKKLIVVATSPEKGEVFALINPRIIRKSKQKRKGEEGCLSFPGIFLEIKRSEEIEVEGMNLDGEKFSFTARDILARVFQHETDHTNGILFFHRLSFWGKIMFKIRHFSIKF